MSRTLDNREIGINPSRRVDAAATESRIRAVAGNRPLLLILLAGAVVRLALFAWFWEGSPHIGDELDYDAIAENLAVGGEFALTPGKPTSIRPPLYPALVGLVYRTFGLENYRAIRLLQAGLSLALVPLMFTLGSTIASRRVGLWAAGLTCFYPSLLVFNNLILTEVLFTVLLCGACLAVVHSLRSRSIAAMAIAGGLIGLGALTRSALWPFPVVVGLFLLVAWKGSFPRRFLAIGTLLAAHCLVLSPWAIRNAGLEKTFQPVDCMGGRNFMMGNFEYTPMYRAWDAISLRGERSWNSVLAAAEPVAYRQATQGQRDKLAFRTGLRFVLGHPWLTARRDLVKLANFWGLEREIIAGAARGFFGSWSAPALLLLTLTIFSSYTAAMLSGVFGAVVVPPADRRSHWFLLLVIAYLCGIHVITFGHSRYHLPLMPLILLYSACALCGRGQIWAQRGRWPFWLAGGICGLLLASWTWEVFVVDLGRFLEALRPT